MRRSDAFKRIHRNDFGLKHLSTTVGSYALLVSFLLLLLLNTYLTHVHASFIATGKEDVSAQYKHRYGIRSMV